MAEDIADNLAKYAVMGWQSGELMLLGAWEIRRLRDEVERLESARDNPTGCGHNPEFVKEGPKVALRWGSGPTEVCGACGMYRTMHHKPGPWLPGPVKPIWEDDYDEC